MKNGGKNKSVAFIILYIVFFLYIVYFVYLFMIICIICVLTCCCLSVALWSCHYNKFLLCVNIPGNKAHSLILVMYE